MAAQAAVQAAAKAREGVVASASGGDDQETAELERVGGAELGLLPWSAPTPWLLIASIATASVAVTVAVMQHISYRRI